MIPTEMPWWRSKSVVGAAVSILLKVLVVSGLTGEFATQDQAQITDLVLLLLSAVGDLVAIGSRVSQKYAPTLTGGGSSSGLHMLAFAVILPFALIGCATTTTGGGSGGGEVGPPSENVIEQQLSSTVLDERSAYLITTAYTAANLAATTAIETGAIRDPQTIATIGEMDRRAYSAVMAVRSAYEAGNSRGYLSAVIEAQRAIDLMVIAVRGEKG